MGLNSFIKDKWQDFVDCTDAAPEGAIARKLEPTLNKEQRERRAELVRAIHLAADLQKKLKSQSNNNKEQTTTDKLDDRLTVHLLFKEKFLIEPEIWHYQLNHGALFTAKRGSGRMRIIFCGNYSNRQEIAQGMQIVNQTRIGYSTTVELKNEQEEFTMVQRAHSRGYNFSILFTLTILVLLSSLQAVVSAANVPRSSFKRAYAHTPNVIDTSHHIDKHVQMLAMPSDLNSRHLHDIAIMRDHAKGMWLPSHPVAHLIRKHGNSMNKTKVPESRQKTSKSNSSVKPHIVSPDSFTGRFEDNLAILSEHGYDVEPLIADMNVTHLNGNVENTTDVTSSALDKRIASIFTPFVVKVSLIVGNIILGGAIALGCQLLSQAEHIMEVGKNLCFGAAFLIASLGIWGSLWTQARFLAARSSAAQHVTEIAMEGVSTTQGFGVRGLEGKERLWFENHLDFLQEAYEESLQIDKQLLQKRDGHYDVNTGQAMSSWDIIMAHIHPIQHAVHPGFNSSVWFESNEKRMRNHGYVSLHDGPSETDLFGNRVTFGWNQPQSSTLQRRQCEETDTETDFNEDAPENYCEEGQSVGPEGVYSSYEVMNTSEQEDGSAHLRLGNDSYALEKAKLEGMLAYLGGSSAVCEDITFNDDPMAYSVMQLAFAGDPAAGFNTCDGN